MTKAELAGQMAALFVEAARDNGERFTKVADDVEAPEWLMDAVYGAHASMMPDDRIYHLCQAALQDIAQNDSRDAGSHEFADRETDIYTYHLLAWAASHPDRVILSEEAYRDNGETEPDVIKILQAGQYEEAWRVYDAMEAALEGALEAADA